MGAEPILKIMNPLPAKGEGNAPSPEPPESLFERLRLVVRVLPGTPFPRRHRRHHCAALWPQGAPPGGKPPARTRVWPRFLLLPARRTLPLSSTCWALTVRKQQLRRAQRNARSPRARAIRALRAESNALNLEVDSESVDALFCPSGCSPSCRSVSEALAEMHRVMQALAGDVSSRNPVRGCGRRSRWRLMWGLANVMTLAGRLPFACLSRTAQRHGARRRRRSERW